VFLARWARRLSWKEVAGIFQTSWEMVYRSVAWVLAMTLYVGSYAVMYWNRRPAANMFYFIYSENSYVEEVSYHLFYPLYWIHRHVFWGQKHNDDRERIVPS
jgi:hypothetical protein